LDPCEGQACLECDRSYNVKRFPLVAVVKEKREEASGSSDRGEGSPFAADILLAQTVFAGRAQPSEAAVAITELSDFCVPPVADN